MEKMLEALECARFISEDGKTVWAYSNGTEIWYTKNFEEKQYIEDQGFWLCSIFQGGHKVEA